MNIESTYKNLRLNINDFPSPRHLRPHHKAVNLHSLKTYQKNIQFYNFSLQIISIFPHKIF